MPKKTAFPRLRTHVRKGAKGQVWTSWSYDGRPDGKSDTPLGSDYETAIAKWRELHEHKPRIRGTIQEAMEAWAATVLPAYDNTETRKSYTRHLKNIKPFFGPATWDQVGMPELVGYLERRTAKTQGNREMAVLSIIWNFARKKGLTKLPWPAAGMEKSKWKNKETPRQFEVTDALFEAVYGSACSVLKNCMDLASATGMRLTDVRTILLPPEGSMLLRANKTGKKATFSIEDSPVLTRLLRERRAQRSTALTFITTPTGRPLSPRMLRQRYDKARIKAAKAHPELAADIKAMILRDMRSYAADLAGSLDEASELLQHSNKKTTRDHYRTRPVKLRPVR